MAVWNNLLKGERNVLVMLLGFAIPIAGCSSPHTHNTKRYTLPAELTLEAHALRGSEGDLHVVGTTNFPDGMKMRVYVGAPPKA